MRQALGGVFALAGAALAEPGLTESGRARLEQIIGQTEWLAELVNHGLADPDPAAEAQPLDLTELAYEAAIAERVTYRGELELTRPAECVLTRGDRVAIRRIVANLLSNATRAAGPTGQVRVETGYDRNRALLIVDDSGPGFGQIAQGTGLGLRAVSRGIIACTGRIEYGRAALGGVRVRLWLPSL